MRPFRCHAPPGAAIGGVSQRTVGGSPRRLAFFRLPLAKDPRAHRDGLGRSDRGRDDRSLVAPSELSIAPAGDSEASGVSRSSGMPLRADTASTAAAKRYPWRGTVTIYWGRSGASPSAL